MNMQTVVDQLDNLLGFVNQIPALCEPLCDPLYGYVPTDDEKSTVELKSAVRPRPVILDCGTGSTKIGFAGNTFPSLIVPNIVCRQTAQSINCFVGDDAIERIGRNFHLSNPIRRGIVTNFQDAVELWKYAFAKIDANPRRRCVVVTESPLLGDSGRKQLLEALFEELGVGGVTLVNEALMTLHASGRTTGVVLDVGEEMSYAVPIVDDVIQRHAIQSISMGGRDLTDHLVTLLQQRYSMTFVDEKRGAEQMKKIFGYVATNIGFERDLYQQVPSEDDFYLESGEVVRLGPERFECAESLFEPLIIGKECPSLQQMICDAIHACNMDVQGDLFKNVVVCGGTTMLDGFGIRLASEIKLLLGRKKIHVNVASPSERQFGAWFGASVLAGKHMDEHDSFWVSQQDYFRLSYEDVINKMAVQ